MFRKIQMHESWVVVVVHWANGLTTKTSPKKTHIPTLATQAMATQAMAMTLRPKEQELVYLMGQRTQIRHQWKMGGVLTKCLVSGLVCTSPKCISGMGMFELPTHLANNLRNHAMYNVYIYFFPNKSLDLKLFEKVKRLRLCWGRRVEPSAMGEDEPGPCSAVGQWQGRQNPCNIEKGNSEVDPTITRWQISTW